MRSTLLVLACAAAGLAACGGSAAPTAGTPPTATSTLTGKVKTVSGDAVTLTSAQGDVVFHFSSETAIGQLTAATPASIAKGDCAVASGVSAADASVSAGTVELAAKVAGRCPVLNVPGRRGQGGPGGPGGSPRPGFSPGVSPGFSPDPNQSPRAGFSPRPTGSPGGNGRGFGASAEGTVDTVTGNSYSLVETRSGTAAKFTVNDNTRVTRFAIQPATALAAGVCAEAIGTDNSDGSLAAQTVLVSQPVNGNCQGGGNGRPGGGGGGRPSPSPSAS